MSFCFLDSTEHSSPALHPHHFIRRLRQAKKQGKVQRRQGSTATSVWRAGRAAGQAIMGPCPGEWQGNDGWPLSRLLPLSPPAPSFQARMVPRYGMVFLGQGRGQDKQREANSSARRAEQTEPGVCLLGPRWGARMQGTQPVSIRRPAGGGAEGVTGLDREARTRRSIQFVII